ncbi:MAG: O-antigen ligase family protein [Deltaproteobacteria bacterium]|nr:O-antigen ligase family protein [Deltaproteobacteria bacterium]
MNNKVILIAFVLFTAAITGLAICDKKLIYFAVVLSPLIIYLCIHKPFIFPFGLYALLIPFDGLLAVAGVGSGATVTKLLGILTMLVLLLKGAFENKLKKPDSVLIWWVLLIMYGFLSVWWAIDTGIAQSRLKTAFGLLLLYLVVGSYRFKKNEFEAIKWCIMLGGLLAALLTIYFYESGLLKATQEASQRATISMEGRYVNPNAVGFDFMIPIAICGGMMLQESKKIIKVVLGLSTTLMLFGIIVTGSRGAMLGLAVIIIVYILSAKQKITYVTWFIVLGIILMPFIPDLFFERWSIATSTGGAGRVDIWHVGFKSLGKHWLTGAGLNNFLVAYEEFALFAPDFQGYNRGAHNTYLKFFVELGIVGITLFLMVLWKHYKAIQSRVVPLIPNSYDTVILKSAFWAIMVLCFFGDKMWTKSFWLLWMMICMYGNVSTKNSD